jgi:hypothetical protein
MNFKLWSRVRFCLFILGVLIVGGAGNQAYASASPFNTSINIVFDDGRVMFYKGAQAGITVGDTFSVNENGETIAKIEIEQADPMFSIARVTSFTRELREGSQYSFEPSVAGETAGGEVTTKKTRGQEKTGTEQAAGEEKTPEEKGLAKTSQRRKKVGGEEEAAAPAKEEPKKEAAPQEDKSKQAKTDKKQTSDKKTDKKSESKEKEVPKKKESSNPEAEAAKYPDLPSSFGLTGSGLSGMFIIPTANTLPVNHAKLSWNYSSLRGSDSINMLGVGSVTADTSMKSNGFYFGYGIAENAEIAISEVKNTGKMTFSTPDVSLTVPFTPSKTTAFSIKYSFTGDTVKSKKTTKSEKQESGVDFALMATMANDKDKEADRTKYFVYGLAVGVQAADNVKVNGLYGSTKASVTGLGSESEKMWGLGLEYMSNAQVKILAEYLKESRYSSYKSLGVQYLYDEHVSFDLAYQIYQEDISEPTIIEDATLTTKGYLLGANYIF